MPIFVKLNLKKSLSSSDAKQTNRLRQLNSSFLESSMLTDGSVVSGMRQQTRIIQRASSNAFFANCADLESDLSCSATILSNIFSNIVSARHEIVNLPGLNKNRAVPANLSSRAAK